MSVCTELCKVEISCTIVLRHTSTPVLLAYRGNLYAKLVDGAWCVWSLVSPNVRELSILSTDIYF